MHSTAQALLEAHLDFLDQEFQQHSTIQFEFEQFYQWFGQQQLQSIWPLAAIQDLLIQQVLNTPATAFLIEQIAQHIAEALNHPLNDTTTIEQVIPVETIDRIAKYVSTKSAHRQRLIQRLANNPAYAHMLTQIIQQTVQGYMDNSFVAKKVPGMSSFMKMGKAALERATDTNLDDALKVYLEKNISKLSQLSERVINQYFSDERLYHMQANLWHKIKKLPFNVLREYIEVQDLPQTVAMGHEIWDFIRQTPYLEQQVRDGIAKWYERNQSRTFHEMLLDLNISPTLIEKELSALLCPIVEAMIAQGYLRTRARHYLERFYASAQVEQILAP